MQAAKRDPGAAEAAPGVSPSKGARVRRTHAAPTPVRSSPRVPSQKTHARTHRGTRPSGRRRVRTQQHAEHIKGHVRQPRLVKHGPGGPTRAVEEAHDSRHWATGWRRPLAVPPLGGRSASEGRRGPAGSLAANNGAQDPCPRSSHTPRRSRASRSCSVVSGPPR